VVLALRWLAPAPEQWSLSLVGDRVRLPGTVRDNGEVAVPTRCDEWGLGETTAPPGAYRVELAMPPYPLTTEAVPVAESLTERTPVETLGQQVRMRARQSARGRLVVELLPPLAEDELGPRAQRRLQEEYAAARPETDPTAVYLQAYTGEVATDSALAIHDELRRTRPDLTLYWGVASPAVRLPDGAVPVLMRSRRWYDVLASAGHLVNNIDFDRWFVKRPGQRFLQTFHGYPAKTMGLVQWRAKRWPPSRIEAELERTARTWDLILTPVPEMNEHYRREYAYDGAIHDRGYPRDDALTGPDAEAVRERTRTLLGVEPGQIVVLYAPTFRDHLATAHRSVELVRHLDLEAASEALGPDYVLLMRGHRFHARGAERLPSTRRLVDVTDYPEVNDLVLAADAAVLDYSSLRFDFALTGKPMVFLVPDLELYSGGVRGFLFDFRSTAPGPLLGDADQVVAALRDLDAVRATYAGAIAELNRGYQYWQDGRAAARVVEAFFR
jgi:CDP-glycerol glycerophosphotransferase